MQLTIKNHNLYNMGSRGEDQFSLPRSNGVFEKFYYQSIMHKIIGKF